MADVEFADQPLTSDVEGRSVAPGSRRRIRERHARAAPVYSDKHLRITLSGGGQRKRLVSRAQPVIDPRVLGDHARDRTLGTGMGLAGGRQGSSQFVVVENLADSIRQLLVLAVGEEQGRPLVDETVVRRTIRGDDRQTRGQGV